MALNFPNSPTVGQIYTEGGKSWEFNGTGWIIANPSSVSLTDATFNNITVSGTGNFINFSATGNAILGSTTITDLTATSISVDDLNIDNSITGIRLENLENVDLEGAGNLQVLTYNAALDVWFPSTSSGGGGSSFNGGTIINPLVINNDTESTGIGSGALQVLGGSAFDDDMYVSGNLYSVGTGIKVRTSGSIEFYNTSNSNFVGLKAPDSVSTDKVYVLPAADGSSGQFLKTDGLGNLSWASAAGSGGGTPPGGNDTYVQFNDANSFGGDATFTFNKIQSILTVPNMAVNNVLTVADTTESTNEATGSLVTSGGAGITGQLNVAGAINKFTGATNSTSINTGTVVVTGGVGISESVNVGSTVTAGATPTEPEHLTNKQYVDANVLAFSIAFGA